MGATYVDVTIRNPAAPARSWAGRFLVDTGAFNSLAPRRHLEAIGLEPKSREEYALADGTAITMDTTVAEVEFEGKTVGGTVIFGDEDAEPLHRLSSLRRVCEQRSSSFWSGWRDVSSNGLASSLSAVRPWQPRHVDHEESNQQPRRPYSVLGASSWSLDSKPKSNWPSILGSSHLMCGCSTSFRASSQESRQSQLARNAHAR